MTDRVAETGMHALDHRRGGRDAAFLQPQQGRHIVGQIDLSGLQVPFPHAAAGRLDGDAETLLGLAFRAIAPRLAQSMDQIDAHHAQAQKDGRDQHPGLVHQGVEPARRGVGERDDIGAVRTRARGQEGARRPFQDHGARRLQRGQVGGGRADDRRGGLADLGGAVRGQDHALGRDDPEGGARHGGQADDTRAGIIRSGAGQFGHLCGGEAGLQHVVLDRQRLDFSRRQGHFARHQKHIGGGRQGQAQHEYPQPGRHGQGAGGGVIGGATPRLLPSPLYARQGPAPAKSP
ncbi:hypothetical protein QE389_002526 [Brevundimonas sp. SORGH_AS 993]|nr:hypothetical protein [Brevundimonas sp. SORGH_AS_0993]